ncbi:MAG: DUF2059 domain-containing protein [Rhodobacteraceae bacterium]|nr:DUF2059 domain-containing protein [Paracoccaceae bacterium]
MTARAARMARGAWCLVRALAVCAALLPPPAARADGATAERLGEVLRLDEVVAVLREEGEANGRELDRDMLGGNGGAWWARQVARIHDADRMKAVMVQALGNTMSDAEIAAGIAFFDSATGRHILTLETSARRAMADPEIEAIARAAYAQVQGSDDARLAAVARFVAINDLLERNVAGVMNATYQFYRGMADGGTIKLDDRAILADVWSGEEETRADTESWLFGFLLMAYRPLSDVEMADYNAFSRTGAGQALNAALFEGFEVMYRDISHALGLAAAQAMSFSEL